MPDIAGFRALTYDPSRVDLSQVVAPPYDVIDARLRAQLADRHPRNFVHVDLPEAAPGKDRYQDASERLALWRKEGVLHHDSAPAVYRYHQMFVDQERGCTITRKGVLAAVTLSPWSEGVIRRHETTFAGPREDRFRLLDATRVHMSPIMAMYDGAGDDLEQMFEGCHSTPDLAAVTDDGTQHHLWRIAAPEIVSRLSRLLSGKSAYVLDGHHRYETMLAFAERQRDQHGPRADRALMFLVPMTDPGLVILPTHRIVFGVPDLTRERLLEALRLQCDVRTIAGAASSAGELRQALHEAPRDVPTFAVVFPRDPDAHVVSTRRDRRGSSASGDPSHVEPEIAVMHKLILEDLLAIPPQAQKANLRHVSNTQAALDQIAEGAGQLGLIVRPPELAQLKRLSDTGRVMPQKSTYFFPKLASGLIMMPVE